MSTDELLDAAMGILELQERQRVRLFVRRDLFSRFFSCLVFIPRERYTTTVRERIERVLVDVFGGAGWSTRRGCRSRCSPASTSSCSPDPAATPVFDVARARGAARGGLAVVGRRLAASSSTCSATTAAAGSTRAYRERVPAAYEEDVTPADAVADVARLEALRPDDDFAIDLYEPADSPPGSMRLKLYRSGGPIAAVGGAARVSSISA